jgi:hypothetical protein
MRRPLLMQMLLHTWASPGTLIGVTVGLLGVCTGGKARRVHHTLEFHGGFVTWALRNTPVEAMAMTLGHVVIGRSPAALDITREHEWVHVRQYERWGPLFIPAYLGWSLALWLARRDAYLENPFEREAFEHDRLLALGEVDRRSPYDVG